MKLRRSGAISLVRSQEMRAAIRRNMRQRRRRTGVSESFGSPLRLREPEERVFRGGQRESRFYKEGIWRPSSQNR